MGFLDKKERVIDIQLTEKGREMLARNQFKPTFYAFSDDGIDYSGSFSNTGSLNIDDYMANSFLGLEADGMSGLFNSTTYKNRDFKYFLFTTNDFKTIPEFNSLDAYDEITLQKYYKSDTLQNFTSKVMLQNRNIEFNVIQKPDPNASFESRKLQFAEEQKTRQLIQSMLSSSSGE